MAFIEQMAQEAVKSNRLNNSKGVYRIVQLLAGERFVPLLGLRDDSGELATPQESIDAVWVKHFVKVFGPRVCPLRDVRPRDPGTRGTNAITQLANGKGLGPDGSEAEIVKAAAAILDDVGEYHYVQIGMRGGRIAELYKGKGDSRDP